jgi:hypothetical protein
VVYSWNILDGQFVGYWDWRIVKTI